MNEFHERTLKKCLGQFQLYLYLCNVNKLNDKTKQINNTKTNSIMAVLYKPFQSILENENHEKLFHPRVIYTTNITTAQISKEIAAYSSLSPGDVKNTLDNLVTVVTQHLQSSESVTLDGFGTFRIVMKSNGKGVLTPEKVSAAQASLTVRFLPCSTKNPDRTTSTRSLVTGAKCVRFDKEEVTNAGGGNSGGDDGDDKGEGGGGEAPDPGI